MPEENKDKKRNVSELTPATAEDIANAVNRLIDFGDYNVDTDDYPVFKADSLGLKCIQKRSQEFFSVRIPNGAAIVLEGDWDSGNYDDPALGMTFHWADGEGFEALSSLSVDFYSIVYAVFGEKSSAHICVAGGAAITE